MIILPRQARDKHRETQERDAVSAGHGERRAVMATWQVGLGVHWQEGGLLAATQRCADIYAAGRCSRKRQDRCRWSASKLRLDRHDLTFVRVCCCCRPRFMATTGAKNGLFEQFIYKNDDITKTGSDKHRESTRKGTVLLQDADAFDPCRGLDAGCCRRHLRVRWWQQCACKGCGH